MRTTFDQYINLRPSKAWHPYTPLKGEKNFDITFLRENTEDLYMGAGGFLKGQRAEAAMNLKRELYTVDLTLSSSASSEQEFAFEIGMMSRRGIERFADYCFDTAKRMGKEKVTAVDKANVCTSLYGLWREVFNERSEKHGIPVDYMYVDAMAMALVRAPERFGVVACPNMFGDGHGEGRTHSRHLAGKIMMDTLGRPDIGRTDRVRGQDGDEAEAGDSGHGRNAQYRSGGQRHRRTGPPVRLNLFRHSPSRLYRSRTFVAA